MDLWVKNQSKTGLYKVNNVVVDNVTNAIVTRLGDEDEWLGFYESKERTLEVLGEIQKLLMGELIVLNNCPMLNDEKLKSKMDYALVYGTFGNNNSSSVDFIHRDCVVFEMPEN